MIRLSLLIFLSFTAFSGDLTFEIPPVTTSMNAGDQTVKIVAKGSVTGNQQGVTLRLSADLSDFQDHMTELLRASLNKSDRCGERLTVDRAAIQPQAPSAALTVWVHYEKWACVKALGKQVNKRLVGGNATIPVKVTPVVSEDNRAMKLTGEVGEIQADGSLGDVLRSESFGDALQQKIRTSILAALDKSANLHVALPESVAGIAKIGSAAFADSGGGRLSFELAGDIALPFEQIKALTSQPLK